MTFVDGENFTIRGQQLAAQHGLELATGPFWRRDTFLWGPSWPPEMALFDPGRLGYTGPLGLQAFYYTSVLGDEDSVTSARLAIRDMGFEPNVFRRTRGGKSKGVDIALTTNMLARAFRDEYDLAVLITGDGDYVPLIREVQRLGKYVRVVFFGDEGLNPELRIVPDRFHDITQFFLSRWNPSEPLQGE